MTALLEMRGISKVFPGVRALDNVTLSVEPGEIHAICGENGAGKSTLMKVLSGVYPHGSYEGDILYEGKPLACRNIRDSEARGIIIIHQELALVPLLSIAENLFLGNETAKGGVINWPYAFARTADLLAKVGLSEPPTRLVGKLGVGKQQLIEIAKALAKDVKLLILDEPTAALQENDSQKLLDLMLELKAQGVTQIIISHKLNEIGRVADRITIIRDGATVATLAKDEISEERIIRDMVGRDMANRYPARVSNPGDVLMEVAGWNVWHPEQKDRKMIRNAAFSVRKGEIVGIAGLMGAGRTELAMSLFGHSYGREISGTVKIAGHAVDTSSVVKAIDAGLAYVTEDRKELGLVLGMSVRENFSLTHLSDYCRMDVVNRKRETNACVQYIKSLGIKTPSPEQKVLNLSGGNQQKVVIAKWVARRPRILIVDEPTRGIDVGAKAEVHTLLNKLASEGMSIIVVSSDLPEVLAISDRVVVLKEGRITGVLSRADATQERVMLAATG